MKKLFALLALFCAFGFGAARLASRRTRRPSKPAATAPAATAAAAATGGCCARYRPGSGTNAEQRRHRVDARRPPRWCS